MNTFKMLLLNRFREYKRLVQNMLLPLLSLLGIACFGCCWLLKYALPLILQIDEYQSKLYYVFVIVLTGYSVNICFWKNKACIIIKPASLFYISDKMIKKIIRFKILIGVLKQMFFALIIAFCINGVHWNDYFISTSVVIFCLMNGVWLLSWKIYHKHFSYCDVLILGALIISTLLIEWNLHIALVTFVIWASLFIFDWFYVDIDIEKYLDEMIFNEKLLTAQNFNNMVLLNQYAKEKKLRYLPQKKYPSKLMKRAPIIWKAQTSISRLSIEVIIVSFIIFVFSLLIYKMPFFGMFMFLDQEAVRKMLLSVSIFAFFQISLQSMLKQMDSLLQKMQDGLFIPISNASIVKQFTLIPVLVIAIESVMLFVIIQQKIYLIVICGCGMVALTVVIFTLNIRYKEVLTKFYYIFSIAIFMISFIMMWKY